ncbi:MAG TPA: peptidoglycan-binding protein [Bryobacteraceae bacterium]|jgi:hypothetical protein
MPDDQANSTTGSGDYTVDVGDDIYSIAAAKGHFWQTIWNDGGNAALRGVRDDPSRLIPGDRLTIPPLRQEAKPGSTDNRYRFKRRGVPVRIDIRLWEEEEDFEIILENDDAKKPSDPDERRAPVRKPRVNVPYLLRAGKTNISGTTGADGAVQHFVDPAAMSGTLTLYPGTNQEEVIALDIGQLYPTHSRIGVKRRLTNLGFPCGAIDDELSDDYTKALREFQDRFMLEVTGIADAAVIAKLEQLIVT